VFGRPSFRPAGLRLRLLAAFGLVIFLSLAFAGFASVFLLRDQQAEAAEQRIGRLVPTFSDRVKKMELYGLTTAHIRRELAPVAAFFEVRIFLLDQNLRVVLDTHDSQPMLGATLDVVERTISPSPEQDMVPFRSFQEHVRGQDLYLFTASQPIPMLPAGVPLRQPESILVVAVPATDVTSAWARLLPHLVLAGGVAALFAVAAATIISARITRPIAAMTRASGAMAEGDYDQRVDASGGDEVAALAGAFNQMASQVSRSNRALRQLLGNVSHELKTPLTSIQGFSQALLDGMATDEAEREQFAGLINQEAEAMRALVEDLIYLSSIEAGDLPLALVDVDLDGLVAVGIRRLAFRAQEEQIAVRHDANGASLRGDGRRLEQVVANLLDNAIRFSPAGSEVQLSTRANGATVTLEIHNDGEPIPEQDLSQVFDRFYQTDPARSSGAAHTGLGLAIVRELVQAHGGDIAVRSSRSDGTTFTVRLPRQGPNGSAQSVPREDG
jgi:signal transduction histidine kinase